MLHQKACPTLPNSSSSLAETQCHYPFEISENLWNHVIFPHLSPTASRPQVGLWHFGPESWSFWDG